MPNAPIAGPRRARPAAPPPQPSVELLVTRDKADAPTTSYQRPSAPPAKPGSTRALPPLDYDESGRGPRPKALEETQPGKRHRSRRVLWFMMGIAFGAIAAVFARGDAVGTLQAARAWGASTLRSLEHKQAPRAVAPPTSMATQAGSPAAASMENAPCPVDPGPDDPCAELLAPFAQSTPAVPTVSVDDLPKAASDDPPKVKRHPAVLASRRRAAPAASAAAVPPAEEAADSEPAPAGINPDGDDPPARPTRVAPAPATAPVERPMREPPSGALTSAKNDP
jgi:hypothetical protein